MLKRVASFCLIALITCTTFTRLFYFAGYEFNKEYIAKTLCINRNKPELHCNGKCFLSKKIAEAERKQQQSDKQIQKDLYQIMMLNTSFKICFFETERIKNKFNYFNFYDLQNSNSIFHPPSVV